MARYWVTRAIQEIERHFADPHLTLDRVAQRCGVSACHLSRELARNGDAGFRVRLHIARTEAAYRLLLSSPLRVKEIATAVGYANTSHLCRHFRKAFGISPTAARTPSAAIACLDYQVQTANLRSNRMQER